MNNKNDGWKKHARLLPVLLVVMLFTPHAAQADYTNDYYYTVTNNEVTITGHDGAGGDIVIPDLLGGFPVKGIGDSAFSGKTNITSAVIPDSITDIGWYAFRSCSALTNVIIGDSVTSIGEASFEYCSGLTNVIIGDSVTSIGNGSFANCSGLASVTIGNSIRSIGQRAFSSNTNLTSIVLPDSVTSLGGSVFWGCSGLTNVIIGNGISRIGWFEFWGCSGLTNILIPNSVTSIERNAFWHCTGLSSMNIPDSVVSIDVGAFEGCTGLTNMVVGIGADFIAATAFNGCTNLLEFNVASENLAYASLDGVLFDKSLTTLIVCPQRKTGDYIVPSSVTNIVSSAFYCCSALTSVIILDGVTSIGSSAFSGCTGLSSITIPDSVTSIGSSAFSGCTGLTIANIGNSVTNIGGDAFRDCSFLTSIIIPESVISIEVGAFTSCAGLKNVIVPSRFLSSLDDYFDVDVAGDALIQNIAENFRSDSDAYGIASMEGTRNMVFEEKIYQPIAADVSSGSELLIAPTSAIHHVTIAGTGAVDVDWDLSKLDLAGQAVTWEAWITVEHASARVTLPEATNAASFRVHYLAGTHQPVTAVDGETIYSVWRAFMLGSQTNLLCNQWMYFEPAP